MILLGILIIVVGEMLGKEDAANRCKTAHEHSLILPNHQ